MIPPAAFFIGSVFQSRLIRRPETDLPLDMSMTVIGGVVCLVVVETPFT